MKRSILNKVIVFITLNTLCDSKVYSQCSLNNGSACVCEDGTSACLLLPDLVISHTAITGVNGYKEYSQSGNTLFNGQILVTGATPNTGYGPLHVLTVDTFVCSGDTIIGKAPTLCPDGSNPKIFVKQRIYTKNGSAISSYDVSAGIMSYHNTHLHMHIEDWLYVSLRMKNSLTPDPRQWDIVGQAAKISFCLSDFDECSQSNGYCRDNANQVLDSSNINNYGMGIRTPGCDKEQSISVGYVDIYPFNTPGMNITIPYGTCNGQYWLVVEVDPMDHFMESNNNNNWVAVPINLTKQSNTPVASISTKQGRVLCSGTDSIVLKANLGTSYLWSNGETTQSIIVKQEGNYSVNVTNHCGTALSDTLKIVALADPKIIQVSADTICQAGNATLSASGFGEMYWYDSTGVFQFKGNHFVTPVISSTTKYLVSAITSFAADTFHVGKISNSSGGNYHAGADYITFNCFTPLTIRSIKVYADSVRLRTFQLFDNLDNLLESIAVFIPAGESRVVLNFSVKPGYGYKLFSKTPYLWRDTIPSFSPYRISNIIELYGTGQDKYYPYMYDWEIVTEANKTCESIRQVVFAQVGNRHLLSITGLDTVYRNTDSAVTMTGVPPAGIFFGAGVNGNTFDPSLAGIGTHTVKYAYMDELGCTDSTLLQVTVNNSQSVNQADSLYPIFNVFSNPSSGLFTMKVKSVEPYKIAVYDIMGNQIKDKTSFVNTGELTLDLREFPQGIYTVGIMTKNHSAQKKIIVN